MPAFGDYAARVEAPTELSTALLELERSFAQVRRSPASVDVELGAGWIVLSPRARLIELPLGTLEFASELREALDTNGARPAPPDFSETTERGWSLVHAREPASFGPTEVRVEQLNAPADELLRRARNPIGPDERARFARERGATPEDLEEFLESFLSEGVLIAG